MIVAIIQARIGSTRLPSKVLMDIEGKPMLQRVIERVKESKLIDKVIVATANDTPIIKLALECGITGIGIPDEDDVLNRYYQVALTFGADSIVRVTADCPLIDPRIVDKVIEDYLNNYDYVSNIGSYPDGLDTEVFSYKALKRAWIEAKTSYEREHVTTYIRNHFGIFRLGQLKYKENLSHYKWSVDTEKDLEFARQVYQKLGDNFHFEDILNLIKEQK